MKKKRPSKKVKGQGSIYSDPKSRFFYISYWNGWRQVRESARTEDHKEALATLQRKLGEVATGKGAGPERIRISALLKLFLEDYRLQNKSDLYQAELRINKHLVPIFGELRAVEFSSSKLRAYIDKRLGDHAANATINRELAHLRRAFQLGFEHDPQLVYRMPVIKGLKEDNVREGFLEHNKYRDLLLCLHEDLQTPYVVAFHLGIRSSELLNIERDWVDLRERLIYVNGRVTKNKKPKTVPIFGEMAAWLEMTLTKNRQRWPKSKWLFIWSDTGKQIRDFRGSWEAACATAGVPDLLFHDLRRTAVRNMIRAGVPEKTAMMISGHRTASMLWRYNIQDTRDITDAGRKMETYLESQNRSQHAEIAAESLNQRPS